MKITCGLPSYPKCVHLPRIFITYLRTLFIYISEFFLLKIKLSFFSTLYFQGLRPPLICLRAFNVETSRIEDNAKAEMLVMMRFQWWRDAINSAYKGTPPDQPIMNALAHVLQHKTNLTRYRLQRMLSTREEDLLRKDSPPSLQSLEDSAEGIHSQLLYLQLESADIIDKAADHAATHVGKAAGLAALLRNTARHAQRGRSYLPQDLCQRHGIAAEDLLRGEATQGLRDVVFAIASAAKGHLDVARSHADDIPAAAKPLLLPALGAGLYLSALEKVDFNVFDGALVRGGYSPFRYALEQKYYLFRNKF